MLAEVRRVLLLDDGAATAAEALVIMVELLKRIQPDIELVFLLIVDELVLGVRLPAAVVVDVGVLNLVVVDLLGYSLCIGELRADEHFELLPLALLALGGLLVLTLE